MAILCSTSHSKADSIASTWNILTEQTTSHYTFTKNFHNKYIIGIMETAINRHYNKITFNGSENTIMFLTNILYNINFWNTHLCLGLFIYASIKAYPFP
jgi:hypothetical protein